MSINSREKGKRGERLVRDLLREVGFEARRGCQYQGGGDSPDVVCPDLPWMHIEVKNTAVLNLSAAMRQSKHDAAEGSKVPTVWHKRPNEEWLVTLPASDFLEMLVKYHDDFQRISNNPNHTETKTEITGLTNDATPILSASASGEANPDSSPEGQRP